MSLGWKIVAVTLGAAVVASAPFAWLLSGPDTGQLIAATVQILLGLAAVLVPWFLPSPAGSTDQVEDSGEAKATNGGSAGTGIRRQRGAAGGGSGTVRRSGPATADGPGSRAYTGIEYTD